MSTRITSSMAAVRSQAVKALARLHPGIPEHVVLTWEAEEEIQDIDRTKEHARRTGHITFYIGRNPDKKVVVGILVEQIAFTSGLDFDTWIGEFVSITAYPEAGSIWTHCYALDTKTGKKAQNALEIKTGGEYPFGYIRLVEEQVHEPD